MQTFSSFPGTPPEISSKPSIFFLLILSRIPSGLFRISTGFFFWKFLKVLLYKLLVLVTNTFRHFVKNYFENSPILSTWVSNVCFRTTYSNASRIFKWFFQEFSQYLWQQFLHGFLQIFSRMSVREFFKIPTEVLQKNIFGIPSEPSQGVPPVISQEILQELLQGLFQKLVQIFFSSSS